MYATPRLFRRIASTGPADNVSNAETQRHRGRNTRLNRPLCLCVSVFIIRSKLATFFNRDNTRGFHVRQLIDLSAGPADFDSVRLRSCSQAEGQDSFALRQIARAAAQHLALCLAARSNAHEGAKSVAIGLCAFQPNSQAVIRYSIITKKHDGPAVR